MNNSEPSKNGRRAGTFKISSITAIGYASGVFFCMVSIGLISTAAGSQLIAWGDVDQSMVPSGSTDVVAVVAGHFHNLSLEAGGTLQAWPVTDASFQPPNGLTNVVRMAAGLAHDLALRSDGTVVAWGDNTYGQTTVPAGLRNVMALAAGGYHSLALKDDGSVTAWGDNTYGQISVPAVATNVVSIAAGFYHSIAVRADGALICWGDDSFGQTDVPAELTSTVAVSAGGDGCLALRSDGGVVAWGDDSYGQASVPSDLTNAVAVAVGDYHSLALRADHTVVAWGAHENATAVPAGMSNVVAIAAGGSHSLALLQDSASVVTLPLSYQTALCGSVVYLSSGIPETASLAFQWRLDGTNLSGATHAQLALENVQTNQSGTYSVAVTNAFGLVMVVSTLVSIVPSVIVSPPLSQTIFAGTTVNLGVTAMSMVPVGYQWQFNGTNLAGLTNSTLTLASVIPTQAGAYSVILSNAYGIVASPDANVSVIGLVEWAGSQSTGVNLGNVVAIARRFGYAFGPVLVVRADGTVTGWTGPSSPGNLTNIVAVSTGYEHALALSSDGTVAAWGQDEYGQTDVPSDLTNAVAIASGDFHNLALRANGMVAAWGDDSAGATDVPLGLTNVVGIAAGTFDSMALTSDGQVIAWGTTYGGDFTVPPGLNNVVAMAAGENHFLALRSDGTVVAWGNNSSGQTNVPSDLTNAVAISADAEESLALTADGKVVAWDDSAAQQGKVLAGLSNVVAIAAGQIDLALIGSGPPHLTEPLVSRGVAIGATTSFRTAATGLLPLSYQWQFGGTNLPGATKAVLTLTNVQPAQAGPYSVAVSNAAGIADSGCASLSVVPVLIDTLVAQPYKQPAYVGSSASFSVVAQGLDLSYQWLTNGVPVPGATNSTLTLINVQLSQAAAYSVKVSGPLGQLTSTSVSLDVLPLWITFQTPSQTNFAGGTASFIVFAEGSPPLSYQWQFNGAAITGATNSMLTLTNLQFNQAGDYAVLVTNVFGVTNTAGSSLTVEPILISDQPQSQTNFPGAEIDFTPTVLGAEPLSYQWDFNGTNLPGATNSVLSLFGVNADQSGNYSLTVSNNYGVATSQEATLVVLNIAEWQSDLPGPPSFLSIPAQVTSLAASGAGWCIAATADGTVIALPGGNPPPPQIPVDLTNVIAVAAGFLHGLGLGADGAVSAWGDNRFGQVNTPAGLTDAVSIAACGFHNLALKSDGTVVGWGDNTFGQSSVPAGLTNVVAISAGTNDSLALSSDGQVWAWGADDLGRSVIVPPDLTNILEVVSQGSLFVAIRSDATLSVWQSNSSEPPYVPPGLSNVVVIAANAGHDLVLTASGTVATWENPTNEPAGVSSVVAMTVGGNNNFALLGSEPPVLQVLLSEALFGSNGFSLPLPTQSGRVYALEYKDTLTENQWKALPLVAGTGSSLTLTDPTATGAQRFYRVRRW